MSPAPLDRVRIHSTKNRRKRVGLSLDEIGGSRPLGESSHVPCSAHQGPCSKSTFSFVRSRHYPGLQSPYDLALAATSAKTPMEFKSPKGGTCGVAKIIPRFSPKQAGGGVSGERAVRIPDAVREHLIYITGT